MRSHGSSKQAAASGTSVVRADLAAATSTAVDVQEAQWRSGVNRQAQADAVAHQQAASKAAAAKRKATAMSPEEKKEKPKKKQKQNIKRRNERQNHSTRQPQSRLGNALAMSLAVFLFCGFCFKIVRYRKASVPK